MAPKKVRKDAQPKQFALAQSDPNRIQEIMKRAQERAEQLAKNNDGDTSGKVPKESKESAKKLIPLPPPPPPSKKSEPVGPQDPFENLPQQKNPGGRASASGTKRPVPQAETPNEERASDFSDHSQPAHPKQTEPHVKTSLPAEITPLTTPAPKLDAKMPAGPNHVAADRTTPSTAASTEEAPPAEVPTTVAKRKLDFNDDGWHNSQRSQGLATGETWWQDNAWQDPSWGWFQHQATWHNYSWWDWQWDARGGERQYSVHASTSDMDSVRTDEANENGKVRRMMQERMPTQQLEDSPHSSLHEHSSPNSTKKPEHADEEQDVPPPKPNTLPPAEPAAGEQSAVVIKEAPPAEPADAKPAANIHLPPAEPAAGEQPGVVTEPADAKPADIHLPPAEPADAKPADTHLPPAEPADAKPADTHLPPAEPADAKPADTHLPPDEPADAKPADTHLPPAEPADAKPADTHLPPAAEPAAVVNEAPPAEPAADAKPAINHLPPAKPAAGGQPEVKEASAAGPGPGEDEESANTIADLLQAFEDSTREKLVNMSDQELAEAVEEAKKDPLLETYLLQEIGLTKTEMKEFEFGSEDDLEEVLAFACWLEQRNIIQRQQQQKQQRQPKPPTAHVKREPPSTPERAPKTTSRSSPTLPKHAEVELEAWRCNKHGFPLTSEALYMRFYRSIRSTLASKY